MSLKRPKRWIRLILVAVFVVVVVEFCLGSLLIGLSDGAPITETGTMTVTSLPETDAGFAATGVAILQELGWWQNNPQLRGFSHDVECSQIGELPQNRLLDYRRADRTTLLTEDVHYATLIFTDGGIELHYRLENHKTHRIRSSPKLDLVEIQIGSEKALKQAEQSGGERLRDLIDNMCYIRISIFGASSWKVDYMQRNSFERFLCFDIDPHTGEVKEVAERSFKPCQYFDGIP